MDNLKMQTANKADENFKKLMEMFPNAVTETMDQIVDFGSDDAMQKKWKTFVRKIDTKTDDFSTVLKTYKAFLTEPFTAMVKDKEFTEKWSAANGEWM